MPVFELMNEILILWKFIVNNFTIYLKYACSVYFQLSLFVNENLLYTFKNYIPELTERRTLTFIS